MKERLKQLFADEKEKLKGFTLHQKVQYIFGYYWLWILGIGCAVYLTAVIVTGLFFTVKDYWFYGMFANTMADAGNGSQIWKDFVSYAGYDVKEKKVEINAASWFDPSVKGGTNNSYYQAFVAFVESGDLDAFADIMNVHWQYKKKRSGGMSNPQIDEWYELALANGAQGGKMIGAGGGGFLMFYAKDKVRLRDAMRNTGMSEVRFRFEKEGSRIL